MAAVNRLIEVLKLGAVIPTYIDDLSYLLFDFKFLLLIENVHMYKMCYC